MQTIDIYTTPQCGFCKALKAKLGEKNITYTSHDVTTNEKDTATLTCPKCGHKQQGEIPTDSCIPFYVCEGCK